MTFGSTNRNNDDSDGGFLEQEARAATGRSLQELTEVLYRLRYHTGGSDILQRSPQHLKEEDIISLAKSSEHKAVKEKQV